MSAESNTGVPRLWCYPMFVRRQLLAAMGIDLLCELAFLRFGNRSAMVLVEGPSV